MAQSTRLKDAGPGTPYRRALRLGPRPFSFSVVNSFGGNFVWFQRAVFQMGKENENYTGAVYFKGKFSTALVVLTSFN